MIAALLKRYSNYQLAIFLSSLSLFFGILREFLLVYLLGFTARNDLLQIYLSIFYTTGLAIDAIRLSCLNLYAVLSLPRIILAISSISLPFSLIIGVIIFYTTQGVNLALLMLAVFGSYLHLISSLLVTYKQRNNLFLAAHLINVLPNCILIPGVLLCYWTANQEVVKEIVILTALVPLVQCALLLALPSRQHEKIEKNAVPFTAAVLTCARHFSTLIGEQVFQILTRAAFFNFGTGYLSAYALSIRIYSALRFILIDSYIGSKLASWKKEVQTKDRYLFKLINSLGLAFVIVVLSLLLSMYTTNNLIHASIQMGLLLMLGFYFSTLVRIVYFKINHHESNYALVWRFAIYELLFAFLAFVLTTRLNYPVLGLVWLGYVAKPFAQLLFLRKRFSELAPS